MGQIGIISAAQLQQHSHLNASMGGILNEYSRDGAVMETYRTGALAIHVDNDAERSYAGAGFDIMKQFTVNAAQAGEYRISWEMKNNDNVTVVHARFGVNGIDIPASDQNTASDVYGGKTYFYDVNLAAGERLQMLGDPGGDVIFIRSFRIYYDWAIKYFGNLAKTVTVPITLTNANLIDVTADF